MHQGLGVVLAVVSGSGFPLTQLAIARLGRPGAAVVGAVTVGILAIDVARIATRETATEDRRQAALLYAETAVAALATVANLALVTEQGRAAAQARGWRVGRVELVRRGLLGLLFGMRAGSYRSHLRIGDGR